MMFAKFTLNVLQRFLVPWMNRLIGQEGDESYFLGWRSHLQSEQSLGSCSVREEHKIALLLLTRHIGRASSLELRVRLLRRLITAQLQRRQSRLTSSRI